MAVPNAASTFVLRAYRGPEDHPAMSRAAAAVRAFNGDAELGTVADMDNHYAHLVRADLPRDCALVELDGEVVGYGRASWEQLADGGRRIDCILNIDPAVRGRGIEELLVDHALRRSIELIGEVGRDATTEVIFYVTERDEAQAALLRSLGLTVVRSAAQLVRPDLEGIPEAPLPDGLIIRPIDPADRAMHRRVFEAGARAFADSYGETAPSEAAFLEFIGIPGFDPRLWRVAFDGDTIAGQVLSYMGDPEPDGSRIGWTEAISVQPEYWRRGLARALLAASLRAVRDAGATSAGLGVDMQNPNQAMTLYQSLGFAIVSTMREWRWGPFGRGVLPAMPRGSWGGEVAW